MYIQLIPFIRRVLLTSFSVMRYLEDCMLYSGGSCILLIGVLFVKDLFTPVLLIDT